MKTTKPAKTALTIRTLENKNTPHAGPTPWQPYDTYNPDWGMEGCNSGKVAAVAFY